jgi:hypothetical protein
MVGARRGAGCLQTAYTKIIEPREDFVLEAGFEFLAGRFSYSAIKARDFRRATAVEKPFELIM